MSVSSPPAPLPAVPVDKPRAPQQSSRRFLTGAFVVSLVAHIIFFAVGSQFPAAAPPPPDRLIEVTFVPATPKKMVLAAVPRPRPPRRQTPPKPRRVAPPKIIRVARRVVPPVPKPLPVTKPVAPPKPRIAQATVPNKPVPVKPPPVTRPQTPAHDHPPLKTTNPPLKNVDHSHAAPPAPGFHAKSPRRLAQRLPDEPSYPSHPFEGDTTHNPTRPSTNTNTTRHQDLDLATGSDAGTGPTRNSSRATHLRHSGITGGNHADTQPFLPDGNQGSGGAPDNGAPSRTNSAAPGGTENGSAQERDSNAGSPDTGSADDSGFNHNGLPSAQSEGGNGTRPTSSRRHGNDDAAGATDDGQSSGRSGHRGGSRHHQRLADNPFGGLPPVDKPAPEIRPTPTQRPPEKLPDREAHRIGDSRPEYPEEAQQLNAHGTVVLRLSVSAEGDVQNVQLTQSSGSDILDQAAQQWASGLRYTPARREGRDVASSVLMRQHFNPIK